MTSFWVLTSSHVSYDVTSWGGAGQYMGWNQKSEISRLKIGGDVRNQSLRNLPKSCQVGQITDYNQNSPPTCCNMGSLRAPVVISGNFLQNSYKGKKGKRNKTWLNHCFGLKMCMGKCIGVRKPITMSHFQNFKILTLLWRHGPKNDPKWSKNHLNSQKS